MMRTIYSTLTTLLWMGMLLFPLSANSYQTGSNNFEPETHRFTLKRDGARNGFLHMMKFLDTHLAGTDTELLGFSMKAPLKHPAIEKFKFQLQHKNGQKITIQTRGFYTFEIQWKVDEKQQVYDFWCRFDEGMKKPLSFDKAGISKKNLSITYRSI